MQSCFEPYYFPFHFLGSLLESYCYAIIFQNIRVHYILFYYYHKRNTIIKRKEIRLLQPSLISLDNFGLDARECGKPCRWISGAFHVPVHLEARTTRTTARNEIVGAAISRNNVFGSKRHSCLGLNDNEIDRKAHVDE